MLRSLLKLKENHNFCEIALTTGDTIVGFVTDVTEETFDIVVFEPILSPDDVEVDEEGEAQPKKDESEVDYANTVHTYYVGSVFAIVHDARHRLKPEFAKTISFYCANKTFYKKEEVPAKKREKYTRTLNNQKTKVFCKEDLTN